MNIRIPDIWYPNLKKKKNVVPIPIPVLYPYQYLYLFIIAIRAYIAKWRLQ